MGLDPQTHKPVASSPSCPGNPKAEAALISTRHMAQWESARLEAEARLSKESSLFHNSSVVKPTDDSDFFLRLWNSEVGDAFRNNRIMTLQKKPEDQNPVSSPGSSFSTKCTTTASVSAVTTEAPAVNEGATMAGSDESSISNELEDSSDTALQLLLDFPIYNDMSFLEGNTSFISPL